MSADREYEKLLATIARNIKKYRTLRGMTQEQMADHGFNYRFYQKLESGKYSPNLRTLSRISKFFKIRLVDLLT